jgi:hypothetical protein
MTQWFPLSRRQRLVQEYGAYVKAALKGRAPAKRILIFAQGRTGTWLMTHFLNAHPAIFCDKEILMYRKVAPFGYLTACSRLGGGKIYGCHVQVNQLLTAQRVAVAPFLRRAAAADWQILYMTRQDIVRQSISTMLATRRRQWYSYDKPENQAPQTIDPAELHRWLQRRIDHTAIEQAALRDLPHLTIVYERDLLDPAHHQATMDRVFNYIGVPTVPVVAQTERLNGDLRTAIANYDELIASLRETPFAEYTDLC